MGYIIIHSTGEILGDEQQARKDNGQPYFKPSGELVSQKDQDEIDLMGE